MTEEKILSENMKSHNVISARELSSELLGESYKIIKHKSGLTIYIFPKELSTYYALFGTKYGSVNSKFRIKGEKEYTSVPDGIAHYLEHKLFENSDGEDTFAKYARFGANANAYTSFLTTAYLFSCTENFYDSLKVLIESVTSPYFTKENVDKERGIIGQEIEMGKDNPGNALFYDMVQSLYEKNNVRTDIAGSVESIAKITPELLYKCYNTFYSMENMGLCLCGKIDEEMALSVIDSCLSRLPENHIEVENFYEDEKPEVFRKKYERKMDVAKPLFSIGVKDIAISNDPDERMKKSAALDILSDMMFGKTSEFYNTLYNKGLVSQSLSAWHEHNKFFSMMVVSGDSENPNDVYDYFLSYTKRMTDGGLREKDFERCRRVLYSSLIKSFDSTDEIANSLLITFAFDDGEIFRFTDIVKDITFDYIVETAKSLFKEDAYTLSAIYPIES